MVIPDASQGETQKGNAKDKQVQKKEVRSRQRASTSCTECKRRKQKCNQAKDRPCNNCSRRYPPVPCIYEVLKKATKSKEAVIELHVAQPKVEDAEAGSSKTATLGLATLHEEEIETDTRSTTPFFGARHQTQILQLPMRSSSGASWHGYRELGKDPRPQDPGASIWDTSSYFRVGRYYAYPELFDSQYRYTEIPSGGVALEPLVSLPLEPSRRNSELFYFFIQRLSPFMCSIDGNDAPATFMNKWLPFMTQSPIAIYITLLTSSCFKAASHQTKVENSLDAIAAKGMLINLINAHIVSHSKGVNDESIAAVMSLAYNELVYSDERSTLAHMHGLQEMVRSRGGIQNVEFPLLRMLLLRTDFQIACTLERPLFLYADHFSSPPQPLTTYPIHLDCPFLLSPIRFIDNLHIHNIALETAQILDDVRWLTTSIIYLSHSSTQLTTSSPSPEHLKFLATTRWISSRLSTSTLTPNPHPNPNPHQATIHTTLTLTTQILLTSLLKRQPLSHSLPPPLLQKIWQNMWSVPLPVWKLHPGLFLFVLLVVNPGARNRPEGRFLKGMLGATSVAVGVVGGGGEGGRGGGGGGGTGWDALRGVVGSVLGVQGWLRGGSESG